MWEVDSATGGWLFLVMIESDRYWPTFARAVGAAELADDEQAAAYGSFPTVEHAEWGPFKTIAPPLRMSRSPLPGTAPAPALGADGASVLAEAGVDAETIALLVAASV